MTDPDSCSMTPPRSPVIGGNAPEWVESPPKRIREEEHSDAPICFSCLGEVVPSQAQHTHPQSYLQRGEFERLLQKNSVKLDDKSITTELFDHHFVTQLALEEESEALFYLCRQAIDKASSGTSSLQHRHNIRRFFEYIKAFIMRYSSNDVTSTDCFIQRLLRHLQGLLLHVGLLHDLPSHVVSSAASRLGNQSGLASYHIFHVHLDIRWSLIELLHIITIKYPEACGSVRLYTFDEDDPCELDMFGQLIYLTLWDLVQLALTTHAKMSVNDYRRQTPFSCSCVKELLILLIKLLQYRHNKFAKPSFWTSLYPIMQTLLNRLQSLPESGQPMEADCSQFAMPPAHVCPDPVGFCWWLLTYTAPLYQYDDYGIRKDISLADPGQNSYTALQTLLKATLNNRVSEGHLRCYLRCCLRLCQLWGPNADVVSLLWEHFYKRLNEHFRQANMGLEGLASMCKSPSSWLEQCRLRSAGDLTKLESDSSFHLFLRILAVHLTSPPGGKVNNTWSRVKGRFYTKFHARRMQELTEVGLVNFSSLFLTLAMAADTEEVVTRMCNLFTMLGTQDVARRSTTWRAVFAAVLLYVETARDVGFLADKLVQAFNIVCNELSQPGLDSSRYSELASLVSQYLESTQDVLEMSNSFTLSQHRLLGSGLKDILKVCRENELRNILTFCQAVLSKLRMIDARSGRTEASRNTQSTSDRLWSSLLPFVKSHACSQTPPQQVADVAASFTLLSLNSPPGIETGMKEDFLGLFQYFGWNDQVNASISCRFLSHLLPNQTAMNRLSVLLPHQGTVLIAAWFRCAWCLPSDNDQMTELTRLILKLSDMREVFAAAGMEVGETNSGIIHEFIQALGKKFSLMTDLRQKIEFQSLVKQMLGDVSRRIAHAFRPGAGEDVGTTYVIGGLLAKHCAQILYVKSRPDCILPLLLERLALPRILLTPNKPLPPALLSAIRENLYLYLQGTSRLDFRRDPYIQRKVKEMITQYLPRFPIKSSMSLSATTVHPIVAALSESFKSNPTQEAVMFRHHVLNVVCSEFITSQRSATPGNPQLGIAFVAEVINKTKKPSVIASDSQCLLGPVLELVLQNDGPANGVLQQVLTASSRDESQPYRSAASQAVEVFVNRHLAGQKNRVMRILEVISERCAPLLTPIIPALTAAIRTTETRRGVGLDKQLRVAYFAVLSNLGEEGQAERSALLGADGGKTV